MAVGNDVTFSGAIAPTLTVVGNGIVSLGNAGVSPGAIAVNLTETADPATTMARLADAIRSTGTSVVSSGNQLSLPSSVNVSLSSTGISQTGTAGTGANHQVLAFPGDSALTVAQRISLAGRKPLAGHLRSLPYRQPRWDDR